MSPPTHKSISCAAEKGPLSCCWCKASGLLIFLHSGRSSHGLAGSIPLFQQPLHDFQTFVKMAQDQSLFVHIGATLKETLLSFAFVVLAGLGISVLLWSCPRLAKVLEPYLVVLNSLPKSALAPLLIVWLGARQRTIIVAGMSVAIFGCILNLYTGFGEVNPEKRKLIRTLGGGKKEEFLKIVLPSCIPLILANMKVNTAFAWWA